MALTQIAAGGGAGTSILFAAHQAGDIIVMWGVRYSSFVNPTVPTAVNPWSTIESAPSAPIGMRAAVKVCLGSSEVSGTWTNAEGVLYEIWRGADLTTPIGAHQMSAATSATAAYAALTLAQNNGTSWLGAHGTAISQVTAIDSAPSGFTARYGVAGSGVENGIFDTNGGVSSWAGANVALGASVSWRTFVYEVLEAAALGVTGAGSVTLDGITGAGTGVLPLLATASQTFTGIAGSSVGNLPINAGVNGTFDGITGSSASKLTIVAAGTITFDDLTNASSGYFETHGAGFVTLEGLLGAGSGVVPIYGSGSVALDGISGSSTGVLPIAGAASATFDGISAVSHGGSPGGGTGYATLDGVSAAATARLALVGAGSASLDGLTGTAVGALTARAIGDVVLAGISGVAEGAHSIYGAGLATFADMAGTAYGENPDNYSPAMYEDEVEYEERMMTVDSEDGFDPVEYEERDVDIESEDRNGDAGS